MQDDDLMDELDELDVLIEGIEKTISRSEAGVPDTFVPSAKAIAVANYRLLWLLSYKAAMQSVRRSPHWKGTVRGGLFSSASDVGGWIYLLTVRQFGNLWSVERNRLGHEVEVLAFGDPKPIFFADFKEAMPMAKHCHPLPPHSVRCLRWVPITS